MYLNISCIINLLPFISEIQSMDEKPLNTIQYNKKKLASSVQYQTTNKLDEEENKHTSLLPAVCQWRRRRCSPRTEARCFPPPCRLPAPPGPGCCRRRSSRCCPLTRPSSSSRCRSSSVSAVAWKRSGESRPCVSGSGGRAEVCAAARLRESEERPQS